MTVSRRNFLKAVTVSGLTLLAPSIARADTPLIRLDESIREILRGYEIGFDLRRIDPKTGIEDFKIQVQAHNLYPVASCFKALLVLYYFWYTPLDEWDTNENSAVYRTAVFSNNLTTGELLRAGENYTSIYGNAIEKFNDFLLYTLGLTNGLHSWNWEGSLTEGLTDPRFAPSPTRIVFTANGRFQVGNAFTPANLADGYALLLNPQQFSEHPQAADAIAPTLELLSIPAENYKAPFERAFPDGYIGKDGVLPEADSEVGRVINDAGIVQVGTGTYVLSFMSAGDGEWAAVELLRQIAGAIAAYEAT